MELKEILEAHRIWVKSDGEEGQCADLREANLHNISLREVDLRCANLSGADLSYSDLRHANLRCANLYDVNLVHANLSNADLRGTDLSDTDLLDADLKHADLRCVNLNRADLSNADLRDVTGIFYTAFDSRGWVLVSWQYKGTVGFTSGCHSFSNADEARKYWGHKEYEDEKRGKMYLDCIDFHLRQWKNSQEVIE